MNNQKSVLTNLIWRFAERCGAQGVEFIVSLVLARLLAPEAYGTIALVTVFIAIVQVFVDSGLANALIQKKDADDIDFSTVFYFNLFWCITLYLLMFLCAPFIADFYNDISLIPVIRVLSLTLVISGVRNVQQAYVSRNMIFKKFFYATLGGTIGAAFIGIIMAYKGYGVWALVIQQIVNSLLGTIILWFTVKWRPKGVFSFSRLKGLFSYGWKLLASSLLDVVYNNIRQLIIGKMYSSSDLAFYNKGKQLPNLFITNINSSINSVLLPVMSKAQEQRENVKNMTRRSIKISTYVMAPVMMGLAATAPTIIEILLTEKWLPCVPYLRIFCITYMFYPIHTANLNAVKAMGRSDLFLKLEICKKAVGLSLLFLTMKHGVMAMAYSLFVSSFASQVINAWPNRKLLNYSYLEQLKDILPSIVLAIGMGLIVNSVRIVNVPSMLLLLVQIVLGIITYIVGSVLFRIDSFGYLLNIIREFHGNR